ncbi:hypothetical protein WICMUC_005398 [Wickerhamomyces mucosus]|uniref:LisH domain-containing protein n=1 Tax=Wickerhamomyces mucosus TaxID=1378264 RepID=A0A9P8T5R2_9ASCO|nr:hypothetical protein WICMUC_005398 [Wickerhamomyces mucosus]
MDQLSTTDILVADYLKRKGFSSTLQSFETALGRTVSATSIKYEPLEEIIEDRIKYFDFQKDLAEKSINNLRITSEFEKWSYPDLTSSRDLSKLVGSALVIHISISEFLIAGSMRTVLFVTSNDRKLTLVDLSTYNVISSFSDVNKSVGKCCYAIPSTDKFFSCGMDGILRLFQYSDAGLREITSKQLHKRVITDFRIFQRDGRLFLVSIGWDNFLRIHELMNDQIISISEFKLLSNATSLALGFHGQHPIILVTRLDSSQISYFTLYSNLLLEIVRVSLNDAEFSTHGFTPMALCLSSSDFKENPKIAVGTSHTPYMRVIVTKAPKLEELLGAIATQTFSSEQSLTLPTLRGHILGNYHTTSPQDKFSSASIQWRLDNSGVWIAGDDGIIRGLEFQSGEIIRELKGGHDKRIKCLMKGEVEGKETLVSAGIDKIIVCWS